MKYVDAGYIIGLSVLFLYAVSLVARRHRLERAAAVVERDRVAFLGSPPAPGAPMPDEGVQRPATEQAPSTTLTTGPGDA